MGPTSRTWMYKGCCSEWVRELSFSMKGWLMKFQLFQYQLLLKGQRDLLNVLSEHLEWMADKIKNNKKLEGLTIEEQASGSLNWVAWFCGDSTKRTLCCYMVVRLATVVKWPHFSMPFTFFVTQLGPLGPCSGLWVSGWEFHPALGFWLLCKRWSK